MMAAVAKVNSSKPVYLELMSEHMVNFPWKREKTGKLPASAAAESGESTPATEPQERGAKLSFAIDRQFDLGRHFTSLSLSFFYKTEKISTS